MESSSRDQSTTMIHYAFRAEESISFCAAPSIQPLALRLHLDNRLQVDTISGANAKRSSLMPTGLGAGTSEKHQASIQAPVHSQSGNMIASEDDRES